MVLLSNIVNLILSQLLDLFPIFFRRFLALRNNPQFYEDWFNLQFGNEVLTNLKSQDFTLWYYLLIQKNITRTVYCAVHKDSIGENAKSVNRVAFIIPFLY